MNNKYHVNMSKKGRQERIYKDMRFDSLLELNRYIELEILQDKGQIHYLERQVLYTIYPMQTNNTTGEIVQPIKYKADFTYLLPDRKQVIEEVKGYMTAEYKLKRKLVITYCNEHDIMFYENIHDKKALKKIQDKKVHKIADKLR